MRINITIIILIIGWICTPYFNNLFLIIVFCSLLLFDLKVRNIKYDIITVLQYNLMPIICTITYYIYNLSIIKNLKQQTYKIFNIYILISIALVSTEKVCTKFQVIIKYMIVSIPSLIFRSLCITIIYLIGTQIILKYIKIEFLSYFLFKIYNQIIKINYVNSHILTTTYLISNIINNFFINISLTRDGLYIKQYLNIHNNLTIYHKILIISCKRFYSNNAYIAYNLWNRYITYQNFSIDFIKERLT